MTAGIGLNKLSICFMVPQSVLRSVFVVPHNIRLPHLGTTRTYLLRAESKFIADGFTAEEAAEQSSVCLHRDRRPISRLGTNYGCDSTELFPRNILV